MKRKQQFSGEKMQNTKIEWADHTFNPWIGCTKVGPGCDNCYAEADFDKRRHVVSWGAGQPRKRTAPSTWAAPLRWNREAATAGVRHRVFCASLADVFDNEVPEQWRIDLFDLIQRTPNIDWLLLTKRIGNARFMIEQALIQLGDPATDMVGSWPFSNVWIGATITSQSEADRDIPKLLAVPAAKRFLSMEPLLGPVDLLQSKAIRSMCGTCLAGRSRSCILSQPGPFVDWVIVGGESGPGSRPMHPAWVRSLRDQCQAAGVPFMFKQFGEWGTSAYLASTGEPVFRQFETHQQWVNKAATWVNGGICLDRNGIQLRNGGDMRKASESGSFPVTIMHKVGKKAAGRLLDGREWNDVPGIPAMKVGSA